MLSVTYLSGKRKTAAAIRNGIRTMYKRGLNRRGNSNESELMHVVVLMAYVHCMYDFSFRCDEGFIIFR